MCCNNYWRCGQNVFRPVQTVAVGPRGPAGPAGADGISISNVLALNNFLATTTPVGTPVSLYNIVQNQSTSMQHTDGSAIINLDEGIYKVDVSGDFVSTEAAGTVGLSMFYLAGGTDIPQSEMSSTISVANQEINLSNQFVVQIMSDNTAVAFRNTGTVEETINPLNVTFLKLD